MNSKKIIIMGTAYPFRGGLAAFNERLAQQFIDAGHEVNIITFTVQYPSFLFPGKSQYSEDPPPQLKIKRWIHSYNPINWIISGIKIRKLKADIIICKFWLPLLGPCFGTILWLVKRKQTSIISVLDNIIPHEHRPGDYLFTRFFVSMVDRFIYMSHEVGKDLKKFTTAKPAAYVPHPIYDNFGKEVPRLEALQYLNLDENYRYVLFFGFIRDYKGLDLLYEAIGLLENKLPLVKFIVAGEYYTDPAPYEQQIQSLGITNKLVLRTNFISNDDVKYYFGACDVVVQPYKSATQSGIAQIALHFTKPAIVTKVGGLHEIVHDGKTGFVVKPNAHDIADAIVRFYSLDNPKGMFDAINELKDVYDWRHIANAILLN
jgi:glycosyltransferase involved in cell wall biosynthesis